MQLHSFVTQKHTRYALLGEANAPIEQLIVYLHGYGQLLPYAIKGLEAIVEQLPGTLLLAPEALHRFYVQGSSGRVGASWMTKEDRTADILDQQVYLDGLLSSVMDTYSIVVAPNGPTKLILVGFSQGVATALRWVAHSHWAWQTVVAWGSELPADIDLALSVAPKITGALVTTRGSDDMYFTQESTDKDKETLAAARVPHQHIDYIGGHVVDVGVLMGVLGR